MAAPNFICATSTAFKALLVFGAVVVITGCNKEKAPIAMPEVNDANCQFDRIKALPAEIRTQFADKCATRSKLINSEKKSYS
jgi:entry exclusion lipoprotein TrbK